jgi:anion-transporting  ArsA/GET3 family ATPase
MRSPFFRESRLLIVAGKGGVGKTTVAAVTASVAAQHGLRTLLVCVDTPAAPAAFFAQRALTDVPRRLQEGLEGRSSGERVSPKGRAHLEGRSSGERVSPKGRAHLDGRIITPDNALVEWLTDKRLGKLADRLTKNGALDMIATAIPGIRDILVLGRIKALINSDAYDLVVLDAPASGHAVTMLHSAAGLKESVSVGAIRQQAEEVGALLTDPALTQVMLVTLAERTPVTEAIETAFALEDRVGVRLGPIVVNQVLPQYGASIVRSGLSAGTTALLDYRTEREAAQLATLERLKSELPLRQFQLPAVTTANAPELLIQLSNVLSADL